MKVSLRFNLVCVGLAVLVAGFTSGCRTKRPEKGITVIRSGQRALPENPPLQNAATNIVSTPTAPTPVEPVPPIPPTPPQIATTPIEPPRIPIESSNTGTGLPTEFGDLFGMVPAPGALAHNTVLFAYDSAAIAAKEMAKVKEVGILLRAKPANKVVVDGHCDERGTEEYNRSLGERRALKVREQLMKEGISADRIYTRTFGKDKPAANGHDDSSWAQNRRGEFIMLVPKTAIGAGTP